MFAIDGRVFDHGDEIVPDIVRMDVVGKQLFDLGDARDLAVLDIVVDPQESLTCRDHHHFRCTGGALSVHRIDDAFPDRQILLQPFGPGDIVQIAAAFVGNLIGPAGATPDAVPGLENIDLGVRIVGDRQIIVVRGVEFRVVEPDIRGQRHPLGDDQCVDIALTQLGAAIDREGAGIVPVEAQWRAVRDLRSDCACGVGVFDDVFEHLRLVASYKAVSDKEDVVIQRHHGCGVSVC